MKRGLILLIAFIFIFILGVFFDDLSKDLNNCFKKYDKLLNDINYKKEQSKENIQEKYEKILLTELKSLMNSDYIYKIYFQENKNNNFFGEDFFGEDSYGKELYVIYYLEIESNKDFDKIIYNKAGREGIIGNKVEGNKYEFEIKSFFDLPSDIAEGEITFIKDNKIIGNDIIIVENERYFTKSIEYNRMYTTTFYLASDLSISFHIRYLGDTSNQEIEIKNYDDYIISKFNSFSNYNNWGYQYVYDLAGNIINKIINSTQPEYINVGNLKYNYSGLNYEYKIFTYYPYLNDYLILNLESFGSLTDLEELFFEKEAILPQNLIIGIKGNPYFLKYTLEDLKTPNISYGIIKVEKGDEKYITEDGKVMDLEYTRKVLKQITEGRNKDNVKEKDNFRVVDIEYYGVSLSWFHYPEIEDIPDYFEEKDMPLINLYKIDDKGNYSLSFYPPYDFNFQRM